MNQMKHMNRVVGFLLVLVMLLSVVACASDRKKLESPTGLNASAMDGSVLVTWNAVNGATSYELKVGDAVYTTTETYYIVSGTEEFTYSVIAKAEGLEDSDASEIKTYAVSKKLTAPENLCISETGRITWTPVRNATSYEVKVGETVKTVDVPYFQVTSVEKDFVFSVIAKAEGYESSPASEGRYDATAAIRLAKVENVTVSNSGLIKWDAVPFATSYVVSFSGKNYVTNQNVYQAPPFAVSVPVGVVAKADGYRDSEKTTVESGAAVSVAITGSSEVRSGNTVTLEATVSNAQNQMVFWSVEEGGEFATIDRFSGELTAASVTGDKVIKVVATSEADPTVSASKVITVVAAPVLTQEMLDVLARETTIGFEGYVTIDLYTFGLKEQLFKTYTTVVKTAMDGEHWYAEYVNGDTGTTQGLYYKNVNGMANSIGVSFMNDEEYFPMLDKDGVEVSWTDSGLYNDFVGLKVSDFTFNPTTWRYEYTGTDSKFTARMVAAANPYDFVPKSLALLVDTGEVIGIYAESEDDYGLAEGYRAEQSLTVLVNTGSIVDVKTIGKYEHTELHDYLTGAIQKMQGLKSYTVDYLNLGYSYMTSTVQVTGFVETMTENDCYFDPFSEPNWYYNDETRVFDGNCYGYHKVRDDLYNSYFLNEEGKYQASRAYAGDFSLARPSFAFAAEIFNRIEYVKDDNGEYETIRFYADAPMAGVASTFYYGLGNDIALYGIFASQGVDSNNERFTPYVVVDAKTGYITEACFYYYLGYLYGYSYIKYGDFDTAELPDTVVFNEETFTAREIPTSWDQLTIQVSGGSGTTEDDVEVNAKEYLEGFLGKTQAAQLPFIGSVLGDTYGFGMTTTRMTKEKRTVSAVVFYYDVPLDINYTIESSLETIRNFLLANGFVKNQNDEFCKDGMVIAPVDSSLDLLVYVWIDHITSWDQVSLNLDIPYDEFATVQSVTDAAAAHLLALANGDTARAEAVRFTVTSERINAKTEYSVTVNAMEYMDLFFDSRTLAEAVPVFHLVTGDKNFIQAQNTTAVAGDETVNAISYTYGWPAAGNTVAKVTSDIRSFLAENGFATAENGIWSKGELRILPVVTQTASLTGEEIRLTVTVWKA